VLWQAWTAPAARAIWAAPSPSVTVEFLEADTRVGGREVSLCKVEGHPDIRCECGWLALQGDTDAADMALWGGLAIGLGVLVVGIAIGAIVFERRGGRLMEFAEST